MLVDGYNIIFAWDELKELAKDNLNMARDRLIDILCNYQGFKQCNLILVFDAYKVKGNVGSAEKIHNINVVYTKEAETADMYIEKITHEIGKKHRVRVATSDNLEQLSFSATVRHDFPQMTVAGSKTRRKNYYGYYKFKLKKEVFKTSFFNISHFSNYMIREIYRKMYSVLLYQVQSKLTHHQYCHQYQ